MLTGQNANLRSAMGAIDKKQATEFKLHSPRWRELSIYVYKDEASDFAIRRFYFRDCVIQNKGEPSNGFSFSVDPVHMASQTGYRWLS